MVILDTNMILRYLLNDDQEMADIAEQHLNAGDASVTIEVIAEVVYVLKGVYSMDRDVIAETVKGFLELVNCQEMAVLNLALDTYGNFEKPCFRKHCLGKKPCFTGFSEVMYAAKLGFSRSPYAERNLDFVDCVLYGYHAVKGIEIATFDKKLKKLLES